MYCRYGRFAVTISLIRLLLMPADAFAIYRCFLIFAAFITLVFAFALPPFSSPRRRLSLMPLLRRRFLFDIIALPLRFR